MKRRRHIKAKPLFVRNIITARQRYLLSPIQRSKTAILLFGISALLCATAYVLQSKRVWSKLKASARRSAPSAFSWFSNTVFFQSGNTKMAPVFSAKVVKEFDHDLNAFTQGLVFFEHNMYESTGLYGASSLRRVHVSTGKLLDLHRLQSSDFGEGLTVVGKDGSLLMQALWKVGKGYVYDRVSFNRLFGFSFEGDAWGLASLPEDRNKIFMSDGTSSIKVFHLEGSTLNLKRQFTVFDGPKQVGLLNELEVVGNELWANVWMSDFIVRIDPESGKVNSWIDLRGTLRESTIPNGHTVDVLNGIAYDEASSSVYVTGKYWPKLFSIDLSGDFVAENISDVTNAFFLNPEQVEHIHKHVIA
ncbi:unnamed protein product [Agarophyton chilense]